jgi:3-hydroxyacyl-CoA dehydrogenase
MTVEYKISVVGMGAMGAGIAQAMISGGVPVVVYDNDPAAVKKAIQRIQKSVRKQVDSGKISQDRADSTLALLSPAGDWADLAGTDLVVEAVFEDLDVKRAVLKRLEEVCSADTILATNTSTISLDDLAAGMQAPGRLVGMHFFNPAHRMPLVEVIQCRSTRPEVVSRVLQIATTIGKSPVLVKNREGFIVNRMFLPYLAEAFWLLQEGADPRVIDRIMLDFGFPMGPLVLADVVGLDILLSGLGVLGPVFEHHGPVPEITRRLVEEGHLGQKSGSGVYKYDAGDSNPVFCGFSAGIVAEVQDARQVTPRKVEETEIGQRLIMRLVNEAFHILADGIAQREADIDVAMVLGTGFPDVRGGPVRYARELGLKHVLRELETLTQRFGKRFSPSRFLHEQIKGA